MEKLFSKRIFFHLSTRRIADIINTPSLNYHSAKLKFTYIHVSKTPQVIEARAIVDSQSGKISMVDFEGEYDMTRFYISIIMGKDGFGSLSPARCSMRAKLQFYG